MSQFIVVDGVQREVVRVACPVVPGNPNGWRLDYRDHMAPGEQTVEEAAAKVPAEWGDGLKAKVGTRPDDSAPGVQVDSQGLDPIRTTKLGRPRKP